MGVHPTKSRGTRFNTARLIAGTKAFLGEELKVSIERLPAPGRRDLPFELARKGYRRLFDPTGHYNRPDVFRLGVDTSERPIVTDFRTFEVAEGEP